MYVRVEIPESGWNSPRAARMPPKNDENHHGSDERRQIGVDVSRPIFAKDGRERREQLREQRPDNPRNRCEPRHGKDLPSPCGGHRRSQH